MSLKVKKENNNYIVNIKVNKFIKAINLYELLNSKRLDRIQLKYNIEITYELIEGEGELLVKIIITGDTEGIQNVKTIDKIINLIKTRI